MADDERITPGNVCYTYHSNGRSKRSLYTRQSSSPESFLKQTKMTAQTSLATTLATSTVTADMTISDMMPPHHRTTSSQRFDINMDAIREDNANADSGLESKWWNPAFQRSLYIFYAPLVGKKKDYKNRIRIAKMVSDVLRRKGVVTIGAASVQKRLHRVYNEFWDEPKDLCDEAQQIVANAQIKLSASKTITAANRKSLDTFMTSNDSKQRRKEALEEMMASGFVMDFLEIMLEDSANTPTQISLMLSKRKTCTQNKQQQRQSKQHKIHGAAKEQNNNDDNHDDGSVTSFQTPLSQDYEDAKETPDDASFFSTADNNLMLDDHHNKKSQQHHHSPSFNDALDQIRPIIDSMCDLRDEVNDSDQIDIQGRRPFRKICDELYGLFDRRNYNTVPGLVVGIDKALVPLQAACLWTGIACQNPLRGKLYQYRARLCEIQKSLTPMAFRTSVVQNNHENNGNDNNNSAKPPPEMVNQIVGESFNFIDLKNGEQRQNKQQYEHQEHRNDRNHNNNNHQQQQPPVVTVRHQSVGNTAEETTGMRVVMPTPEITQATKKYKKIPSTIVLKPKSEGSVDDALSDFQSWESSSGDSASSSSSSSSLIGAENDIDVGGGYWQNGGTAHEVKIRSRSASTHEDEGYRHHDHHQHGYYNNGQHHDTEKQYQKIASPLPGMKRSQTMPITLKKTRGTDTVSSGELDFGPVQRRKNSPAHKRGKSPKREKSPVRFATQASYPEEAAATRVVVSREASMRDTKPEKSSMRVAREASIRNKPASSPKKVTREASGLEKKAPPSSEKMKAAISKMKTAQKKASSKHGQSVRQESARSDLLHSKSSIIDELGVGSKHEVMKLINHAARQFSSDEDKTEIGETVKQHVTILHPRDTDILFDDPDKKKKKNSGNMSLRFRVRLNRSRFAVATNDEKETIIKSVFDFLVAEEARFLRPHNKKGWVELSQSEAHKKIGENLSELADEFLKTSEAKKAADPKRKLNHKTSSMKKVNLLHKAVGAFAMNKKN